MLIMKRISTFSYPILASALEPRTTCLSREIGQGQELLYLELENAFIMLKAGKKILILKRTKTETKPENQESRVRIQTVEQRLHSALPVHVT